MDFFYTGFWGQVWLAALAGAAILIAPSRNKEAHRAMVIIAASWLMTRSLIWVDGGPVLHSINDAFAFIALAIYARSDAASFLYFLIFQVGVLYSIGMISRSDTGFWADAFGLLTLLIVVGGAYVDGAGFSRRVGALAYGNIVRRSSALVWNKLAVRS